MESATSSAAAAPPRRLKVRLYMKGISWWIVISAALSSIVPATSWGKPMDDSNTTTTGILEADEDILTYTVSDEATEAAAGIERGGGGVYPTWYCSSTYCDF
jgi:hypothetical protein